MSSPLFVLFVCSCISENSVLSHEQDYHRPRASQSYPHTLENRHLSMLIHMCAIVQEGSSQGLILSYQCY